METIEDLKVCEELYLDLERQYQERINSGRKTKRLQSILIATRYTINDRVRPILNGTEKIENIDISERITFCLNDSARLEEELLLTKIEKNSSGSVRKEI